MGLFDALTEIASAPICIADAVRKDLTEGDEADAMLSIATLGTSSAVKGIGETVKRAADKLDE
ncbi:MAG: hypothetical protein IJ752_06065 [Alphaproteobacteria bacterium]|nr:hypothetical protein [Alphaproteobacteria bacterium]